MGFDLFLQSFQNGEHSTLPFTLIERGFGPYKNVRNEHCWVLHYPDGGHCEHYVDTTRDEIKSFMVARPRASPEFGKTLLDLLREMSNCPLLAWRWPGDRQRFRSGSPPPDMIEALGEPTIVSAPEEICEAIQKS